MIRKLLLIFWCGLCFADRSFSQCAGPQSVTVTPAPGAGNTYTPGEVVTFCYTVKGYDQINSNWFHGLTFNFGPGWDVASLTVISLPNPASGAGAWAYYPNGETGYYSGQHFGAGFYFGTNAGAVNGSFAADGNNPGENYGDNCASGACTWTFCFSIEVSPNAAPGTSLELQVTPSGDGSSGSWVETGCAGSPYTLSTATVALPVLSASATSTNVTCFGACNGTAIATGTHGTAPYTYKWNTSPQQTTDTILHLCPGTYTCTLTDAAHTTATASVTITQPTVLAVTDSLINPTCHGTCTGAILVNVSGGTLPYTYLWSAGAAPNASADYAVCAGAVNLTVTDSNHCSITESDTLIDPPADSIHLISQTNVLCYGASTGALTVSAGGGTSGNFKFRWSNSKLGASDTLLAAGTYSVTATDSSGCPATASYTISQPATAVVIDSPNITSISCYGFHNGAITAKATGGTGSLDYSWKEVSTSAVLSGQTISNLGADTYNLTVTDSVNCKANASYQLNNPSQLMIDSLTYSEPACYGAANGSTNIVAQGGTGTLHYSWNGAAAGLADSLNNISSGMLRVTVTDSNNCNISDSVFIGQPAQLAINLVSQENVLCHGGNNGNLTISASGGTPAYTYLWNNGQTGTMDTALFAGVDSVTVTDANTCTLTQTFQILQTSTLAADPIVNNTTCFAGANGSVNANPSGGATPYSFLWSDSQTVQVAHNLTAGAYSCTVTDSNGCTVLATDTVDQPAALVILDSAIAVLCSGQSSGRIIVSATGGIPSYDFSATQDETNFNFSDSGTIYGLDTGTWLVYLSDINGCTIDTPVYVPNAIPDIFNISTDSTLCYGDAYTDGAISITVVSVQNAPYQFSLNGEALQDTGYFPGLAAGPYLIFTTNTNGCNDTLADTVHQPPPISIGVNPDTLIIALGQGQIVNITYSNITNPGFNWQPTDGLSCVDCPAPVIEPYYSGAYTVTASMHNGDATCTADATVYVEVIPQRKVYVPNVFSPNGDGNNDVFQVYGDNIQYVEMKIFNRWGELVFASTNQYNGWNGTYKGQLQLPGVFVYEAVITFLDGTQTSLNGSVTLLR